MFDIGFSELMVIAVVALVVIGPERLPGVARTMGALFGRLQRYVNDVKADINREIQLDELRKFKTEFEDAAHSVESQIRDEMNQAESSLQGIAQDASLQPEIEKIEADIASLTKDVSADPHALPQSHADVSADPHALPQSSVDTPETKSPSPDEPKNAAAKQESVAGGTPVREP